MKLGLGVCHLVSLPPTPVDFVQSIHFMLVKFGLGGLKIDFVGKLFIRSWLAYQGTHFVLERFVVSHPTITPPGGDHGAPGFWSGHRLWLA